MCRIFWFGTSVFGHVVCVGSNLEWIIENIYTQKLIWLDDPILVLLYHSWCSSSSLFFCHHHLFYFFRAIFPTSKRMSFRRSFVSFGWVLDRVDNECIYLFIFPFPFPFYWKTSIIVIKRIGNEAIGIRFTSDMVFIVSCGNWSIAYANCRYDYKEMEAKKEERKVVVG